MPYINLLARYQANKVLDDPLQSRGAWSNGTTHVMNVISARTSEASLQQELAFKISIKKRHLRSVFGADLSVPLLLHVTAWWLRHSLIQLLH